MRGQDVHGNECPNTACRQRGAENPLMPVAAAESITINCHLICACAGRQRATVHSVRGRDNDNRYDVIMWRSRHQRVPVRGHGASIMIIIQLTTTIASRNVLFEWRVERCVIYVTREWRNSGRDKKLKFNKTYRVSALKFSIELFFLAFNTCGKIN